MKTWSVATMTLVFALAGTALASAAGGADDGEWRFNVVPIAFWGLNIEGPVVINGEVRNVNASFSDIKSSFNSAAGLGLTVGRGAWSGFFNGSYLELLEEHATSSLAPGVEADVTLEWTTLEFGGSYRLPIPPGAKSPTVELMGGARFNQLKGGIEATSGATFDEETDISWTDPFVGMSVAQPITKGLMGVLRGDVGGFGLSSNQSKYSWNVTAGMAYRWPFTAWALSVFGGYKISEYQYEKDDPTELQLIQRMQGPVIALNFTF